MATRTQPNTAKRPAPAAEAPRRSARERLLEAAEELFYSEGINTVGIDRVIERAGVAKASLYDTFGSKEELIRAYVAARHDARVARLDERLKRYFTPRDKLMGIFESMGEAMAAGNFRGCAFVRAGTEMQSAPKVKAVIDESRAWLKALFRDLARQAGAAHPDRLAHQFVVLYDGAAVSAQMDGPGRLAEIKAMAQMLLEADLPPSRKRG